MSELEDLRTEVERLRSQGLEQMESWDAEQRETKRLHAAVVRYRHKVSELESQLEDLEIHRDTERERAESAEQAVQVLKLRVDELIDNFRAFGEHKRECQLRSLSHKLIRKKNLTCTCGFEAMIAGGGAAEEAAT